MIDRPAVQKAMAQLIELVDAPVRSCSSGDPGSRIHHLETGAGPPVVLLHGGTGGGANWFRLIGPLSRSFRVLAPDLPGFGLSDAAPPSAPLSLIAAERLQRWMQDQDISGALLVGTSFGGLTALRLAQRSPTVERLLLLDSAGLGRALHPLAIAAAAMPGTFAMRPSRAGTAAVFRMLLTTDGKGIPADHRERLLDYIHATAEAAGETYLTQTMRLFAGLRGQREVVSTNELEALHLPVSIVWGAEDRLIPVSHAHAAARMLPNASLRVISRVGHSPNWERPDDVLTEIRLLARRPVLPEQIRR